MEDDIKWMKKMLDEQSKQIKKLDQKIRSLSIIIEKYKRSSRNEINNLIDTVNENARRKQ